VGVSGQRGDHRHKEGGCWYVRNYGGHGVTRVPMVPYDFAWDLQERPRAQTDMYSTGHLISWLITAALGQDDIIGQKPLSIDSAHSGKTVKTSYEV
jgi:hypothetical protein